MKPIRIIIAISICIISAVLVFLFFSWRSIGDSPAGDSTWRLTESGDRPNCVSELMVYDYIILTKARKREKLF